MPFVKRTPIDSDDDVEEIREAFDLANDSSFDSPVVAAAVDEVEVDDDEPATRASTKKATRKLLIGGAIVVGLLFLLSKWATIPEESAEPEGEGEDDDVQDGEIVLSELGVRLDSVGYSIDGVSVSPIGDGPKGFFLAAGLEQRGAIPGTTTIVLDFSQAPHAHASAFEDALRDKGFKVAVTKLGAAG